MEFPQFEESCKSALRRHLTEDVFEKLKDVKTSRGVTLKEIINSGVVNQDSSIGVYVGDEESYSAFGALINPIIEEYHKPHKVTDSHPADFDPSHLDAPNPDPDDKYIISTRIRVARNVKSYGLTPTLRKDERVEVEKKVVEVLESLTDDLKGTYYPLSGMDDATAQQLIDDHFLFKKGDRFLDAAGINSEWPEGRGIFHNDNKTFLTWVNEEDQLRIISMQKGGDIGAVFSRLAKAVNELSDKLGFQYSPNLGYLSSCPTNLGTGMRASVHIRIPHASQHADFNKICDEYCIQPRGIHGEHSQSSGGVYDISNKRRLGLSEVACVQDMYNGVKKLIELEQSLESQSQQQSSDELAYPEFKDDCKSALRRHLTKDVFDQLKSVKTSRGVTLKEIINSGVVNQDSSIGVYVGDEESYSAFGALINPIIEEYHKPHKVTDSHPADFDPSHLDAPNPDPDDKYIISTRIRVARNVKSYGLTPTLRKDERVEVEKKVVEVLESLTDDLKGTYYPLSGMDDATAQQLIDDHFLFKKGDRFLDAAGINSEWPEGRGIFHNDNKTFLTWVNEEDQLRIISMQKGGDIGAVFSRLAKAVNELSDKLGFQYSPNLGYLSSCPTNLGTGMRASVHIRIPHASQHADFNKICDEYCIQPRGIHGEHSQSSGGVYDISNKRRLGLSEVACVQDMYNGVKKLIELEQSLESQSQQQSSDELAYPEFKDDCKSALRRHLTKDVFDQLKSVKTSRGVTLKEIINSGVVNQDSSIGVYVGDEESYSTFGALINPIIEEYHKPHKVTDSHPADFDPSHLDAPNPDPDDKYIISTRIRVARNVKSYGLTPTLRKDERVEVEKKVVEVLESLTDDLKGTYYPLSGMDDATAQQLIDDHFLFKKGDRFLDAAGINSEWPEGRGIFHNDNKTFLTWVNEEDQLRIISMQKGGDIGAVFSRLAKAVNELSDKLGFQYSPNLGYLSSCPTNLGTGMRASVHIRIPHASQHADFNKICDEYCIQPRGIHGEHSQSSGGVYDISNKRRLGLSEVACVQDMYNGVKKLIELEQSLESQSQQQSSDELAYPEFKDNCKSALRRHLTKDVFDQLKSVKTSRGVTLKEIINSGVVNQDSSIGVYVGDEESYSAFGALINPIIEEYHKPHKVTDSHPADFDPSHLDAPNPDPDDKYIISTRIRVARNVKSYGLTPTLRKDERVEVEKKVVEVLESLTDDLKGTYYPLSGMDDATAQQLIDDHFLFKKGDRFLDAAGINSEWPEGRGIFHNDNKTFLTWVNEEDQLRIISMQKGGDIGAVFSRLAKAVNELSDKLGFQYSPNLGYLSSCPTNLGTGMRASVHIRIPHASQHADFNKICDEYCIQPRGIHGEHSQSSGGVYDISNKRRLGLSEVACVQDMYNGVKKLIELEQSLESQSQQQSSDELAYPEFKDDCKSALRRHLTKDVFDQLKSVKTSRGVTLKEIINSGVVNQDSSIGVYVGDEESYSAFGALINPIIEEYHKPHKVTDSHPADFDPSHLDAPNPDPDDKYIISTRIRVARNVKSYGLTPTLRKDERVEVEKKVVEVLESLTEDLKGTYYPLSGMDDATAQQLIDDHFLFKKGDRFLDAAGINSEWPEGRGIFHNDNKTFLTWVNEEDQLRIISMQKGGDIGAVFSRLAKAVNELSDKLGFQYSPNLGYLSSCPTNLGTGMRASVHIRIPHASQHADFNKICDEYCIQPRGIHGEHSQSSGGVYDISNKRRLGLSEVACVQDMYNGVKKLIELEQSLEKEEGKKGADSAASASPTQPASRSPSSPSPSRRSKSCVLL